MLYEQFFSPVLIVDDEPLVLKQLCNAVSALGYFDVRTAAGYEEAQLILETTPVSLLITDIALPDGDGRRLASDALRLRPGTTIVLISGFPAHSLMLSPELRNHAHLLEKPFGLGDLRGLLQSFHDHTTGLQNAAAPARMQA